MKELLKGLKYPIFELWKTSIATGDRLKILNSIDFPDTEIIESLGIKDSRLVKSFGLSDENEIDDRLQITKFLAQNQDLSDYLAKEFDEFSIPETAFKFMDFFDPKHQGNTPYWDHVKGLHSFLQDKPNLPPKLKQLSEVLENSMFLSKLEWDMGRDIDKKLEKSASFEGTVDFKIYLKDTGIFSSSPVKRYSWVVAGVKEYSHALNPSRMIKVPERVNNSLIAKWSGVKFAFSTGVMAYNYLRTRIASRKMVMYRIPKSVKSVIAKFVTEKLKSIKYEIPKEFSKGTLRVYFAYDHDGLRIQFYGLDMSFFESVDIKGGFVQNFASGHSFLKSVILFWNSCLIRKRAKTASNALKRDQIYSKMNSIGGGFFTKNFPIKNSEISQFYKWFAIGNEYCSPDWYELFGELNKHRKFYHKHLNMLVEINSLVRQLKSKAKELKTTLCFPEILQGSHIVDFEEIYPIQLLFRLNGQKAMPVSMPTLNGSMISLTGKHGGGKTESQFTIVSNLYLAQSGLPVLGKSFRFNVKKAMGMVFVTQKGEGSTVEILISKFKNILEGILDVNPTEVVLVLDEVGTGTQESSGFELGRDILTSLANRGVSVVFSTQITSLAEYARDNLGAVCYFVDRDHNIKLGINDGGLMELRHSTGLESLLKI